MKTSRPKTIKFRGAVYRLAAHSPVVTIEVHTNKPLSVMDDVIYTATFSHFEGVPYDGRYSVKSTGTGRSATEAVVAMVQQWARAGFLE